MDKKDEGILVNPDELENKRRRRKKEDTVKEETKSDSPKYFNNGETVKICFESLGRFDMPKELCFGDFNMQDVNDITLSRQDELLENLVSIINKKITNAENVDVGNMVLEEFLEVLVGIKMEFNTPLHQHSWICDKCQGDKEGEEYNTETINLETLEYTSIEEADENVRKIHRKIIESLEPKEYNNYLINKYKNDPLEDIDSWTIDKEVENIKVQEPVSIQIGESRYSFRFPRVKDFIKAQKMAKDKYAGQLKRVENRREHGVPLAELKQKKQDEIEEIKHMQAKDTLLFARALTLVAMNGEDLKDEQKIQIYPNLPRKEVMGLISYFNDIKFGIQHDYEFICPICGHSDRRLLQQELNPLELLPLDSTSSRKQEEHSRINIFIGA